MSKPKRPKRTITLEQLSAIVERRQRGELDKALPTISDGCNCPLQPPTTVTLNATIPGSAAVTGNAGGDQ